MTDGARASVPSKSPQPHKKIDIDAELTIFSPWRLAGLTLRNRIIRAAAFDGTDVADITATHEGVAKGGVGMTVVAYCCVSHDGRTFEDQIDLTKKAESMRVLRPVVDACHKHGAAICAQLTHGGSFSSSHIHHGPNLAPSSVFNPAGLDFPKACDQRDMDRLVHDFVQGALFAVHELGFDAVELHCGHGYFLSQWMSPLLNGRTDDYGGSPQNRARFPQRVLKAIRQALGKDIPILIKMNAQDGVIGGLELPDALIAADMFADDCDMIVVSCGLVAHNAFYLLRGTTPLDKLILALPGVKRMACFLFGPLAVPAIQYDDCFLRDSARAFLKRLGERTQICMLGGVSSLTQMEGAMEEGFAAVQMARPLIREPDFILRIQREILEERERLKAAALSEKAQDRAESADGFDIETKCIRCNQCVIASVDPTKPMGCPFRRLEEAAAAAALTAAPFPNSPTGNTLSITPTIARSILQDIEDVRGPRM